MPVPVAFPLATLAALMLLATSPAAAGPVVLVNALDAPTSGEGLAVAPGDTVFVSFSTGEEGNLSAITVLLAGQGEVATAGLGFGLFADTVTAPNGSAPGRLLRRLNAAAPGVLGTGFTAVRLGRIDHVHVPAATRLWIGITAPPGVGLRWATTADLTRAGVAGEFAVGQGTARRSAADHPAPQMQVVIDVYEPPLRVNLGALWTGRR